MTVNERLFVAGLIDEWDAAIVVGDRQAAIEILTRVGMPPSRGEFTVDTTLADPEFYGFPPRKG